MARSVRGLWTVPALVLAGAALLAAAAEGEPPAVAVPEIGEAGPVDPGRVRTEFDRYLADERRLAGQHDAAGLEGRDVFGVLEGSGLHLGPGASGFRPFRTPKYKGRWRWPLRAGIVSSDFGPRWGRSHDGLDIAADLGVPVYAAAPGTVLYAGNGLRGYGNVVILRHDQNTTSLYAHNEKLKVRKGQEVERGEVIALLGSTGRSTGPHVHFEIRRKKKALDPGRLLPKSKTIKFAKGQPH